jgi:hypothetical protein
MLMIVLRLIIMITRIIVVRIIIIIIIIIPITITIIIITCRTHWQPASSQLASSQPGDPKKGQSTVLVTALCSVLGKPVPRSH